jgi:hypothetical protein
MRKGPGSAYDRWNISMVICGKEAQFVPICMIDTNQRQNSNRHPLTIIINNFDFNTFYTILPLKAKWQIRIISPSVFHEKKEWPPYIFCRCKYLVLELFKKCKLERDMTLCGDNWLYEEASLKKSGSSLLNSARKQWCQCLRNIKIKFKCEKRIFPFNKYVLNFSGV